MARFLKLRRVQAPPPYHRGIPVVNLLPPEDRSGFFQQFHQEKRLHLLARGALALLLAVGAFTAWNLYAASQENEQSLHEVTANLTRAQNNVKRVAQLRNDITEVERERGRLQEDWRMLTTQTLGLVPALQEVFRSMSPEVTLVSVKVSRDGQITIQGETSYVPALLTWQERLTASVVNLRMVNMRLGGSGKDALFTFTSNMKLVQ